MMRVCVELLIGVKRGKMRGLYYWYCSTGTVSTEYDYYACISNWCLGVNFMLS